jgi:hypothetical protein
MLYGLGKQGFACASAYKRRIGPFLRMFSLPPPSIEPNKCQSFAENVDHLLTYLLYSVSLLFVLGSCSFVSVLFSNTLGNSDGRFLNFAPTSLSIHFA